MKIHTKQVSEPTRSSKKILVLTLDSGENELKNSLKVLKNQTYKNWSHIIFSNLPNKNAHEALYGHIMKNSKNFDLFIKLDADMVLINKYALENIINFLESHQKADQANFSVYDSMSGQNIMGLIVFTNRAHWLKNNENLFVDHTPVIPGKRFLVWGAPSPIALHCPTPHYFQIFHFGAHRALKAIQKNRLQKKWIQSAIQWHLLMGVWKKYSKFRDRRRALMMLGAYRVWNNEIDIEGNEYNNKSLMTNYKENLAMNDRQIYQLLNKKWRHILIINHLLYILLWPKIVEYRLRCSIAVWID